MLEKLHRRLSQLDQLIKQKATGSPKELAKKLGITERCWYKLRDELINDLHVPIAYSADNRSYIYTEDGNIEIGFRKLSKDKTVHLNGGESYSALCGRVLFPTIPSGCLGYSQLLFTPDLNNPRKKELSAEFLI